LQAELDDIEAQIDRYEQMLEPILERTVVPEVKELAKSWSDYIDEMYFSGRH
jgi:hypothetical protein